MALATRSSLRKSLDQTEFLDPVGLTPFVALHLGGLDHVHVYRSSAVGFVETEGAPDIQDPGWRFVLLSHLKDCLRVIDGDQVEVVVVQGGGVMVRSVNTEFDTELRVHTVARVHTGTTRHDPGAYLVEVDTGWLQGLDVRSLTLVAPPVLHENHLTLMTPSGIVQWGTSYDANLPASPRESFLKAVSAMPESGVIQFTKREFFDARVDGMHYCTAGHRAPVTYAMTAKTPQHSVPLPASRTIQALRQALTLAATGTPIQLSPRGVTSRDLYGNPARFSLGDTEAFPALNLTAATAKMLTDTLGQTQGESVLVGSLEENWFRASRGACEVSFRTIS